MAAMDQFGECNKPLLFYDGLCGLCHGFVGFVAKHDKHGSFYFAPIQGETARRLLPTSQRQRLDSVIVRAQDGRLYEKSRAVLFVGRVLGGRGRFLAALGALLPKIACNWAYDWVAQHRYRLFGRKEQCELGNLERGKRFLS